MKPDKYICPGCQVEGEHKCFFDDLKSGEWIIDCQTDEGMAYYPKKCNCYDCLFDRLIKKFQSIFTEEEQDDIFDFLDFRVIFRGQRENSAKIKKIVEKRVDDER